MFYFIAPRLNFNRNLNSKIFSLKVYKKFEFFCQNKREKLGLKRNLKIAIGHKTSFFINKLESYYSIQHIANKKCSILRINNNELNYKKKLVGTKKQVKLRVKKRIKNISKDVNIFYLFKKIIESKNKKIKKKFKIRLIPFRKKYKFKKKYSRM